MGNVAPLNLGPPGTAEPQLGIVVKKMAPGGGAKKEEFDRGRWFLTVRPSNVGPR